MKTKEEMIARSVGAALELAAMGVVFVPVPVMNHKEAMKKTMDFIAEMRGIIKEGLQACQSQLKH